MLPTTQVTMSILNHHSLTFCHSAFSPEPAVALFSKAVCRLPLSLARRNVFPKPSLPKFRAEAETFARPLPPR